MPSIFFQLYPISVNTWILSNKSRQNILRVVQNGGIFLSSLVMLVLVFINTNSFLTQIKWWWFYYWYVFLSMCFSVKTANCRWNVGWRNWGCSSFALNTKEPISHEEQLKCQLNLFFVQFLWTSCVNNRL